MLIRDCSPGDLLIAKGWDIGYGKDSFEGIQEAWLLPHNFHWKKARDSGQYSTLLYVGPTRIDHSYKRHHFLTAEGNSVYLHGSEFRCLELVNL